MSQYSNLNWQYPGLADVGSYQVSGIPYVTSSTVSGTTVQEIAFPSVTRWVLVKNLDNSKDLKFGFSYNGVNDGNYFLINGGTNAKSFTPVIEVKCSSLFLKSSTGETISYSVLAGLTNILHAELNNSGPSGENWSGSFGVG